MTKPFVKVKEEPVVRLKASHRKGRTAEISRVPRVPTQERSRLRYQQIIEATEKLLETSNVEDLSLYDIAHQARIAPPSVHYLFNTVAAIHIELNRLYNIRLTEKVLERERKDAAARNPSWQAWTRSSMEEAAQLLNANRPMAEVMLGPVLHRKSAQASMAMNASFSAASLATMRGVFVVPDIPNLEHYFVCATVISEALWTGAYMENGTIDEETFEESVRATVAYLRCFLPETLPLKKISDSPET